MTRYSKINLVYRLQKWMDSVPGQTFLNYAYSWGAAVVILGTLFKLTYLPGANLMLYLGMGTEVVVFFLSAFDRPFDKTADGMELPTHVGVEGEGLSAVAVVPGDESSATPLVVQSGDSSGRAAAYGERSGGGTVVDGTVGGGTVSGGTVGGGQTIIFGGGVIGTHEPHEAYMPHHVNTDNDSNEGNDTNVANMNVEGNEAVESSAPVSIPPLTPDMTEATNAYVDELKKLTEVLERVSEQSKRLTTDSEEMENLNRTLTGICKVYEMQLKSASSQIGTIDEINEQTRHMAEQIKELNNIYARMIDAMSVRAGLNG